MLEEEIREEGEGKLEPEFEAHLLLGRR